MSEFISGISETDSLVSHPFAKTIQYVLNEGGTFLPSSSTGEVRIDVTDVHSTVDSVQKPPPINLSQGGIFVDRVGHSIHTVVEVNRDGNGQIHNLLTDEDERFTITDGLLPPEIIAIYEAHPEGKSSLGEDIIVINKLAPKT